MALFESLINSGKADKKPAGFTVTMVHYSKLIPSENNNYSMDSIKELAQMIVLAGGVKQNLLARKKTPDEYDLIAGHRRRQAVKYLVEELGREEYAMMPVHVEKDGDLMSEVNLILTNCGARNRSDWERMMEVTRLTDLLKAMQTGSQEEQERFREWIGLEPGLSGRELRKLVSDLTGMSETKIAQLNHINNSLAPEMMNKFEKGEIGVSVANEAAGLPPEKQQDLARQETVRLADVKAVSESDTEKTESVAVSDPDTDIPGQQELTRDYPEYCPTVQKNTIDPNIRDVQEEVAPEPIEFDRGTLKKMIREARGTLEQMRDSWIKNQPYTYTKYSMMVQAYETLLDMHDMGDRMADFWERMNDATDQKVEAAEQPELPLLKNNDQRAAFIDNYAIWPLWIDNQETGERYYRYDMPDGTSFVVKVYHAMLFCGWEAGSGSRYEEKYGYEEVYILEPGKFFRDCRSNKSAMIEKLKEIQKEKR